LFSNSCNTKKLLYDFFPYRLPHVEVIYPGVDHTRFANPTAKSRGKALREQWLIEKGAPEETVVLLSVARLSRLKGIDVTLQALAQLQQYGGPLPHWLYVVAGSGPDENEFRAMTQQLGLAGRVIFTGAVPYLETAPLYYAADIYVQPSQPHGMFLESFGISFVEAQYCGLPCIATRFGGIPESVKDGETGILVPPGDINELIQALGTLIRDRERRSSMASRAREHARAFSWDTHARKLEQTLTDYCIPPRAGMQK
jgi:glycosyltransferase involved in cell wall biosynthesis